MRKLIPFFLLLLVALSCEETEPVTPVEIQEEPSSNPTSCTPMSGSAAYSKTGSYNCHEYVRAALLRDDWVDQYGEPDAIDFAPYYSSSTIQSDPNFIRLCSSSYAEAIAHLPQSKDHSALMVTGNVYAYSFPGPGDIYKSASALNYGTACDYEYFASIEDIQITGPTIANNKYTFTLTNKSNHPYILTDASRWTYDTSKFTLDYSSDTQLVLIPNTGISGSHSVSAVLNTNATDNPTGACATGVNGYETASTYTPTRSRVFTVLSSCDGELDGSSLYTFNYVSSGVQHHVQMAASNWSWTKTSGNATWSTANYGQDMYFTLSYGSVTFSATRPGCNRTISFYAY